MARKLHSRLRIRGTMTAYTALHVGGHGESPDTDLALAQNGAGDFYIPGTSIAGSLRSWCEKNLGELETAMLFGPTHKKGDADGHASFVVVEDIAIAKDAQSEIRDGVGIDRIYGTAADRVKFDRAILPRGTTLDLAITVEIEKRRKIKEQIDGEASDRDETDNETAERIARTRAIFGYLLTALSKGLIRFGAARTRGLGKVKLTKLREIEEQDFNDILTWLNASGSGKELTTSPSIESEIAAKLNPGAIPNPSSQVLEIIIKWRPKSSLMVKAGYDGIGVDMLPLTSGNGKDRVSLCLPGSSIKGAFRSHAERILRTLKNDPPESEFHEQIQVPLIEDLFGAKKESNGQARHLGLGALSIDDCYATKSFDASVWREVEVGRMNDDESYDKQELWQGLKRIDLDRAVGAALSQAEKLEDTRTLRVSHHVAIDRWTGGASEGALFSVLEPSPTIKWNDICLTLDFSRLYLKGEAAEVKERQNHLALMLLLLVLRDFAENRLPLGFATNRGMGEVDIEKIEITGLRNIVWENGRFDFKDDEGVTSEDEKLGTKIRREWGEWIIKQTRKS